MELPNRENRTTDEKPIVVATDEFISRNSLSLNRTQDEIVAKCKKELQGFFGQFSMEVLCFYLDFDHVQEFMKPEALEEMKKTWKQKGDVKEAAQDFIDYMVFAWHKSLDQRGLSAGRSILKLGSWLWLLGREDLEKKIHDESFYNPYGMPALIEVCNELGIVVPNECHAFAEEKV